MRIHTFFRAAGIAACFVSSLSAAQSPSTTRVSLGSQGNQAVAPCEAPVVSDDGRYVAFHSVDATLVASDTNGVADVFVRDTLLGITTRVSVGPAGAQSNGSSTGASISADGRYVVFQSDASNLIVNDLNGFSDVFRHDRQTGTTIRVSLTHYGGEPLGGDSVGGVISADGHYVAFRSSAINIPSTPDTNGVSDIFRWDETLAGVRRISVAVNGDEPNGESIGASISQDGRYVTFYTAASNILSAGMDSNGANDIFLRDVFLASTTLISKSSAGAIGNGDSAQASISDDGLRVYFKSSSTNFTAGDTNGADDIFMHEVSSGITTRVSVTSAGAQSNGSSSAPAASADGRFVAYESGASNLVSADTNGVRDVFIRDTLLGLTSRISVSTAGAQADRQCVDPAIASDGRWIVFQSAATNLVGGDTNLTADVFERDRGPLGPVLADSGVCPGSMTLTVTGATPNATVALAYGSSGSFTLGIPPCAGLVLDIANPTLAALLTASAQGEVSLTFHASTGYCGRTVQAVDVPTCQKTNAIVL